MKVLSLSRGCEIAQFLFATWEPQYLPFWPKSHGIDFGCHGSVRRFYTRMDNEKSHFHLCSPNEDFVRPNEPFVDLSECDFEFYPSQTILEGRANISEGVFEALFNGL